MPWYHGGMDGDGGGGEITLLCLGPFRVPLNHVKELRKEELAVQLVPMRAYFRILYSQIQSLPEVTIIVNSFLIAGKLMPFRQSTLLRTSYFVSL